MLAKCHSPLANPALGFPYAQSFQKTEHECKAEPYGGHPSNRPPAIVDLESFRPCRVLASGVDALSLSLSVGWKDKRFFEYLSALKEKAQTQNSLVQGILEPIDDTLPWKFDILPHGVRSYTWLLSGKDYFLKIFNSINPTPRPSVTIEIRSEALWANGPVHAAEYILDVLEGVGADIIEVKTSRIDLCADLLFDSALWTPALKDFTCTTARLKQVWDYGFDFSGLSIGKGQISARLYDKVREISQKSKKFWMFDIWGIPLTALPSTHRIIRIEFQLRREALKTLINCEIFLTLEYLDRIWAYCTQDWLKFQDNPGMHHTKRRTFDWWIIVQNGFQGVQSPAPFIRKHARKTDKKQLCAQIYGLLTSLHAITLEEQLAKDNVTVDHDTLLFNYIDTLAKAQDEKLTIRDIVTRDTAKKRARYHTIK